MILLIKLFLAHLLGDFFLQPQSWVNDKAERKLKSSKFYLHIAIHVALMALLVWDFTRWPLVVAIGLSHFAIDALKLMFQTQKSKRRWFFIDQLLHVISILAAYAIFVESPENISDLFTEQRLLFLLCAVALTQPVSILMKTIFQKWDIKTFTEGNESLEDAGKYIGILERILVFVFVVLDHWEAVGFLITAKSVFRFGDLMESKQRRLTEYVLIGTLISFGIAIFMGLLYRFLM